MPRSPRYDRLTPDDCRLLHEASLTILERTGVVLHDAEAVERLTELVGTEIGLVSTGPDREQTIIRGRSALAAWFD